METDRLTIDTTSKEGRRTSVRDYAQRYLLVGLLDLYDLCESRGDNSLCDQIIDFMINEEEIVFRNFFWTSARMRAVEVLRADVSEKERRKEELLRRIEQITDTNRKMWVKTMHCIDEILPPKQEAMNFGLQVIRGTYAGWSAEELRPHLMVDSLCILAEDAEKFVH